MNIFTVIIIICSVIIIDYLIKTIFYADDIDSDSINFKNEE